MPTFSNKMHGEMVNSKPISLIKMLYNESCLFVATKYITNIMDRKSV